MRFVCCFFSPRQANPTRLCLVEACKEGFGFEAASIGELRMSQRANKSAFVVYDSPLKTVTELTEAVELGAVVTGLDLVLHRS